MITSEWPTPDNPSLVPFIVRQVEFLRKANVSVDVFSFRGAKNPVNYARAWYRVHRMLRQGSYDLVHAQWGQSALPAIPTRIPLVVTFRGGEGDGIVGDNGEYTLTGHALRAVGWFVSRRADQLVLVSSHMRRFVPDRPVHVIPSGLDFSKLTLIPKAEARRQLKLPQSRRLVLFAGNPAEARKRYPLASEVVSRLDPALGAQLVLAWNVAYEQIPLYMNACDALLFVSMWEGSPNVVKEALACNLPVVSIDVGDVAERLAGVEGSVLCPDADPDRLAAALDGVLRANRRVDSRSSVMELDENRLVERMIRIYRIALSRPGPNHETVSYAQPTSPTTSTPEPSQEPPGGSPLHSIP
jgi:glycosyltransferase involved in cell wall biosynthesis